MEFYHIMGSSPELFHIFSTGFVDSLSDSIRKPFSLNFLNGSPLFSSSLSSRSRNSLAKKRR